MPRSSKGFKKRRFLGNRYMSVDRGNECRRQRSSTSERLQRSKASKLSHSALCMDGDKVTFTDSGYALLDIDLLRAAVTESCACKFCSYRKAMRSGVACTYSLSCTKRSFSQRFANVRIVKALQSVGEGAAARKKLCSVLDLHAPPAKFSRYHEELLIHEKEK